METKNGLFADVPAEQWNDWNWQAKNRINTLQELKKRVTTANDSFVAMAVSEVWESVDSTLKCVNLALDLCDFIDSFDFPFNVNAEWYAHYRSAEETIRSIHSKLSDIAVREYNLI